MVKVLVVESDRVLADNLKDFFRRAGISAVWRRDLQKAINAVDEHQPEAIVMDLATGGHGGVEFLYELRSYPEWQNLPVVIYSSTPPQDLGDLSKALHELNVTAYHYKPKVSLAELTDDLRKVLPTTKA